MQRQRPQVELPSGLFSGLKIILTDLASGRQPQHRRYVLPLTVTVEKVGEDRVRAKVLAGAPFDGGLHG